MMSADFDLRSAVAAVPEGRWGVAVSGGADSVALLRLLKQRADISLHIVHLNHQLRGGESDGDAQFVAGLAADLHCPVTIVRRSDLAPQGITQNLSAFLRRLRFGMYADAASRHDLAGVLLAHHEDDQIETVLHRLLRGSGYRGLCGIAESQRIGGVELRRPLLNVSRERLRQFLAEIDQPWREDSSNAAPTQRRNRLRALLAQHDPLREPLLQLLTAMRALRSIVDASAARWPSELPIGRSPGQPTILREQSARQWLGAAGVPIDRIESQAIERLLNMIDDAASPSRMDLPGNIRITRRRGVIQCSSIGRLRPPRPGTPGRRQG